MSKVEGLEPEDEPGPDPPPGFWISKTVGLLLTLVAISAVVITGVVVFYAGVNGRTFCGPDGLGGPEGQSSSKPKVTDVRLPRHLNPLKYRVKLIPFIIPENFTIRGEVQILMEATTDGDKNVTLHSAEIDIDHDSVTVHEVGGDRIVSNPSQLGVDMLPKSFRNDEDREFFIVGLGKALEKGKQYQIGMKFVAHLNDNLKGFYRSVYTNKTTNESEYIAVTQFQATDARRAFPCFDEPSMKASFEVSLGRIKTMSSIANMPIKEGGEGVPMEGDSEYVWDHYEESVKMSTYLVAFVVSKFGQEVSPPAGGSNTTFRIWARQDALDQITFAKEVGPKILKHFEDYFDVKYPLPKQDMVAIPDFSAGAMENWGLITYREEYLLFKPKVSAASDKQHIAIVISHELAHQWFGNLVTPSWWTDLWLNEGFASYVEYLGVEAVLPELRVLEQFVYQDLQKVLTIDSLATSHPISIPVKHPDEINEIFDSISYSKGASLIRMMDNFLSEESFRKGLHSYLTAFSFKAADQDDLWHHLTEQAHKDKTLADSLSVKTIMDTWTLQMGYPIVTVHRVYGGDRKAKLNQRRFLLSKPDEKDTHKYAWWIPVTFAKAGEDSFRKSHSTIWMSDSTENMTIGDMPDDDTPVIFNVRQTGYYRVNYDEKNWRMIIDQLNRDHEAVHVINRAQLIDDALNLAIVGLLDYGHALEITSYLSKEKEYLPWASALRNFHHLDSMLERTGAYGAFKIYLKKLIFPLFERTGFEAKPTDQHLDVYLRGMAVRWACALGHEQCIKDVGSQFKQWMSVANPDSDGGNPVGADMKSQVYCNAIRYGNEEQWEFAWNRFLNSNVATEKFPLLSGLTCSGEVWILNRFLNMSLTADSGIRKADGRVVISDIASNVIGRDLAFDFVRANWKHIVDYYTSSFALPGLMKNVMKNRNTKYELEQLVSFQKKNADTLGSAQREVAQAIEKTEANVEWMQNFYEVIHTWLKARIQ